MRSWIVLLCLASLTVSAETYRWVDENGVVNYSDRPHPGAERVDLQGLPTTQFARPGQPRRTRDTGQREAGQTYDSVTIQRPQPEETLWNLEGLLDVQIAVQPEIAPGHRLRLYLDGQPVSGVPDRATSFTIDRVYRGEHTLRAAVEDSGGRRLIESPTVRFIVQQTSVQNPNNPNAPGRPTPAPLPRPRPRG